MNNDDSLKQPSPLKEVDSFATGDTCFDQTDDEFLKKLVEAAREYGRCGDYVEIKDFVQFTFIKANKTPPTDGELKPL